MAVAWGSKGIPPRRSVCFNISRDDIAWIQTARRPPLPLAPGVPGGRPPGVIERTERQCSPAPQFLAQAGGPPPRSRIARPDMGRVRGARLAADTAGLPPNEGLVICVSNARLENQPQA